MANRISVIIDATVDKATAAVKGFRQSIMDADGVTGKFKAGTTAAFDTLKQNAVIGATAAGGALVAFGLKAVGAASDLDESVNAVNVTFGRVGGEILALGEQAAESVGLSNAEFNGLAVQFASFAETVAGKKGDVVGTMDELTTRVADFASVMNLDVPEAARVFQSALSGETEPIKKFGIDLSAASVAAYAVEAGIIAAGESMTESDKTVARYGLLMQETQKTAGDFKNTSDGLANSQRILAAKAENASAAFGKALTPAMEAIVPLLIEAVDGAVKLAPAFQAASQRIGDIVADAQPLIDALGLIGSAAGTAAEGFEKVDEKTGSWLSKIGGDTIKSAITKGLVGPIVGGALEAKSAFDKLTGGSDEVALSLDHLEDRSYRYGAAAEKLVIDLDHLDERQQTAKSSTESLAAAEEIATKAREEATRKTEEHTRALEEQVSATDALFGSKMALVGGDIAVREAQRQAGEAVAALNVLMDEGKVDTEEYRVAQDDAATAVLGAAKAAAQLKVDQAEANGETTSGATKNALLRTELENVAATLAPGSPLRAQIDGYIAELEAIPSEIKTSFTISARGATVTPHGDLIGIGGPRAAGGPTFPNTLHEVTERGSELLHEGGKTYLMSGAHGQVEPLPNGRAVGGAGGLNVIVEPGGIVLSGSTLTPDDVVNALSDFVRRNGPGPIRKLTGV